VVWDASCMRYGISVPNFAEPGPLVELARAVEQRGWDGFFLWDHIVVDREGGVPISEPWTVLAAVATATERVRIGTLVTPLPRRRPWVLARQVTTVDHLSGGRAVLGVGLGVPPELEYAALGESPHRARHAALLDEGLEVVDALWSGEHVAHRGEHHRIDDVRFLPRPLQQPRVPVWVAAMLPARAGVRRAVRWDGIVPMFSQGYDDLRPASPEEVAGVVGDIRAGRAAEGGDDRDLEVVVWALAPDEARRREYEEAGTTWLIEGPAPGADWLEDAHLVASEGPPR
jgi:alkanesulfonate monooxygenase SsuD/methylene tetrahydromethanopterin reductase-like flavin-dependent oxidoreductase (luciferase family)